MRGFGAALSIPSNVIDADAVRRALARMLRRGPDGEGWWHEPDAIISHRRLAILDLDTRATQPMQSACGRFVIAFNGGINNFCELRHELEARGVTLRTTSDTETVLEHFARDGAAVLARLHGMIALVIWDRHARRAFATRDPYDIKPLYCSKVPGARCQQLAPWKRTIEGAWWLRKSLRTLDLLPTLMGAELAHEALRGFDVVQQVRETPGPLSRDPHLAIGLIASSCYLRSQSLPDINRASMHHSLELRTPLVDSHLLAQMATCLSEFRRFAGKSLLSGAPSKHLTREVKRRRKTGFGIPISRWLLGSDVPLAHAWAPRVASSFTAAR